MKYVPYEDVAILALSSMSLLNSEWQLTIQELPTINIMHCEECIYADEKPTTDGRYWCALHQCFMRFCSEGKGQQTMIEAIEELKKAWDEFTDALYMAWHIDKLIDMINWVYKRRRR